MKDIQIGRDSVLKALRTRAPRAMHLMEVVTALEVPKSRRDEVRDVLEELRGLSMVKEMPGNRFRLGEKPKKAAPPPPEAKASGTRDGDGGVSGWLTIHPRGFGFVAVEDGGPDVFVPGSKLKHAMHGDRVRVHAQPSTKGRDGEVIDVVRHGVKRVSGVLQTKRKQSWLETSDPRLPERIEVTGTIPLGIEPGEEVVALIESWPKYEGDQMQARVLSALGPKGSAAVEIEKIKIREGIEEEFTEEVLAEAQAWGSEVSKDEIANREDLRDLELCTIDPPTARDHDDAVWAERLDGGGFRVIVAIADVSYYVPEGSSLDSAALERATSIYLPDRVIPMLPHELSSNLASLVPDEDRLCMAVEVELGAKGAIKKHRFIEGVMRSRARISYQGAARALRLSEQPAVQHEAEEKRDLLTVLYDVSQVLRAKRRRRGSLDFDLPEPEIVIDDKGEPIDIKRSRTDPGVRKCYAMIEDLMLLANEVVAADLSKRGLPAIYRIHGAPDEQRIDVFAELAESLGYVLDDDAGSDPRKLAKFLKRVEGTTHAQALNFLLLRAMQQATYDTANVGHFALAAKNYLHFTSPIRRYPDLAVHRVVRSIVRRKKIDKAKLHEKLRVQAASSSRLERRAMTIDREANNLYRALLMKDRVGERFEATITGVAEHGLFVSFEEPFVEARVPIDTLGDDWYELDQLGLRLVGKRSGDSFALGDRITVRLENVSIEQRELSAVVQQRLPDDRELLSPPDERRRRNRRERKKGKGKGERNQQRESKRQRYEEKRQSKKGGRSLDGTTPRKKTRSSSEGGKKKKGSTRGKRR